MSRIYEEIVDFIARGASPAQLAQFSPSQETKDRVASLLLIWGSRKATRLGCLDAADATAARADPTADGLSSLH